MPRTYDLELPNDTRHWGPAQLLPGLLGAYSMTAWAGWMGEHVVPFRDLIRDHLGVALP